MLLLHSSTFLILLSVVRSSGLGPQTITIGAVLSNDKLEKTFSQVITRF